MWLFEEYQVNILLLLKDGYALSKGKFYLWHMYSKQRLNDRVPLKVNTGSSDSINTNLKNKLLYYDLSIIFLTDECYYPKDIYYFQDKHLLKFVEKQ